MPLLCCFFFFQAEDGIRDADVTGVQTCALPICEAARAIFSVGMMMTGRPFAPGYWRQNQPHALLSCPASSLLIVARSRLTSLLHSKIVVVLEPPNPIDDPRVSPLADDLEAAELHATLRPHNKPVPPMCRNLQAVRISLAVAVRTARRFLKVPAFLHMIGGLVGHRLIQLHGLARASGLV